MTETHFHLHPAVVHFPIALFISALVLEGTSRLFKRENLHRTALHIYIFASLIAPFVVWTGLEEAEEWHLVKHAVFDLHKTFALATMWFGLATLPVLWIIKKRIAHFFRYAFLIFLILIVSFVSVAAYNGGRLVYEYGIGIEKE